MFLFDPALHFDPMLVLECYLPDLSDADLLAAKEAQRGWIPNRKSGGLALMRIGTVPIPNRYKFLFYKRTYLQPFRTDEMKRREKTPEGQVAVAAAQDAAWAKKFPTMYDYMVKLHFDDGSSRQVSKVSIFVENGVWKAALNDPEERCSVYVAGETVEGALKALEAALASGNAEWRGWNGNTKKK